MCWQIEISDEDIDAIEERLEGVTFDEERREVLKCMDSCDVQACAGSGKTTTLVAKLAVIAGKLPSDYRGICVLSHTNAARIELEGSLGSYASRLCRYPHFIGTIQRFVDRFLAIPAMVKRYGARPHSIDDAAFGRAIARRYHNVPWRQRCYIEKSKQGVKTAQQTRYRFDDMNHICVYKQGREKDLCGHDTPSYQLVLSLKEAVTAEGYIGYQDAYALANWYLQEYPEIGEIIAYRFPLVFVDEMQDTNVFQYRILGQLFGGTSVVQCFGDRNQTIYDATSAQSDPGWEPADTLPIRSSHRFGTSMASLCSSVCIYPQELVGRTDRPECEHTIFLFDDNCVEDVIPAFADRIEEEGLFKGPFKAIGAVGKKRDDPTRLSIASYWPEFNKRPRSSAAQQSLRAYFELAHQELTRSACGNCGAARAFLIEGITQLLHRQRGEPYSSRALLTDLRESGEANYSALSEQLFAWCDSLVRGGIPGWDKVRETVRRILSPLMDADFSDDAIGFINADIAATDQANAKAVNAFVRDNIAVEIDTIHGVKGQNHQATLVLESYLYKIYDLKRLLPYIMGRHPQPDDAQRRRLPLIHVAMTRPSHLLCLAMHRDHITDEDEQELVGIGWCIEDLSQDPDG